MKMEYHGYKRKEKKKSHGGNFLTCSNHGGWHRQYPRPRHLAGEEDGRHDNSQALLLHVDAFQLVSIETFLTGANT